jgi:hypothetical protein
MKFHTNIPRNIIEFSVCTTENKLHPKGKKGLTKAKKYDII